MGANNSTDKKSRRDPGIDVTRVSSGFRSERSAFTWKIENFDVVRQSKEQICAQKFEFQVGDKIGLPCKMSCCLHYADDSDDTTNDSANKWIGLYYNLIQAPETAANVNTKMEIEISNKYGQRIVALDGGVADLAGKRGWGFPRVVCQDTMVEQLPLISGCLHIYIQFTIFAPNPTITDSGSFLRLRKEGNNSRGMSRSLHTLLKDFHKLLEESNQNQGLEAAEETSPMYTDVKILTKDQQVYKAHRAILSARSPVFAAMFRNNMLETQTGVVRIQDMSSTTVKVLLQFIYTGTLSHNWHKADVVVELTNAAAKYELKDLLEFLDGNLGNVCDEQTAGKLLLLASRLNLAKAEKQILDYIKQHGVTKSKDFISIVKNIAAPDESEN